MINVDPSSIPAGPGDFELFFEKARDLFCIAGFDGYYRKFNPAVMEALGFSKAELLSRPINSFVHPDDQPLTYDRRLRLQEAKPLVNFENRYVTASGEVIWLSWCSIPDPERGLVFEVAKNITHQKALEADLNETIRRFDSELKDLRELIYTLAHDLRTPAGNIRTLVGLLADPDTPAGETIELLDRSVADLQERLEQCLDKLLSQERSTGQMPELDLALALERVQVALRSWLSNTQTKITADFSAVPTVRFDKAYFDSILLNLISNSIKYAREQEPPFIRLWTEEFCGETRLILEDNGRGFDLSAVGERLFELGGRFHSGTNGKGVGLYLVRDHLRSRGGDIRIDSVANQGSRFTLTFKR